MSNRSSVAVSSGALEGLTLCFGAYALLALQDASIKWLVARMPLSEIMGLRSAAILAALLTARAGRTALGGLVCSPNKPALIGRGVLILLAWWLFFSASAHLALADLTTLYFIAPVIAVVLAAAFLKEHVGPTRWAAVATGFLGVMVAAGRMVGLSLGPVLAVLAAATFWGVSIAMMSWIGRTDSSLVQIWSTNAVFVLGCAAPMLLNWQAPDRLALALILGTAFVSGLGQYLLFEAFRLAPASALAPVEYTGLMWAGVFGYAIWGDVPGRGTMLGAVLITASSFGLVWSARKPKATLAP